MTEIEQCFGNVIGTKRDTTTDSGLYITDLEALSTIEGLAGTDDFPEIADVMDNAKRIAILAFHADLTSKLLKFAKPKNSYRGRIGSSNYTQIRSLSGEKGVKVVCAPIEHAEMYIYSVGVLMKNSGSVDVHIEGNNGESHTVTINANAKRVTTQSVDISLPLFDKDMLEKTEYRIYHTQDPYCLNKIKCSSCSRFYYSEELPKYSYNGYAMIGGFSGSGVGENSMNGILLGAEFRCRTDKLICDNGIDYQHNPLAYTMAQAIQLKAGSVVLWNIMRSSHLNRVLMQDMENFREAASYYERRYRDIIREITKTIPIDGCFCDKGFTETWVGRKK